MKTVPLTVRRCPALVHQALKDRAQANKRSLNNEMLAVLEDAAEEKPVTGRELAKRLKTYWKSMTPQEHREYAEAVQRGIQLMRRERLH